MHRKWCRDDDALNHKNCTSDLYTLVVSDLSEEGCAVFPNVNQKVKKVNPNF